MNVCSGCGSRIYTGFDPIQDDTIKPEAGSLERNEAKVPPMTGSQKFKHGIGPKGRMIVDREWHQRIVLCGDNERGETNGIEEISRGLRSVIICGRTEPEKRGGKAVVELPDIPDLIQAFRTIRARRHGTLPSNS